GMRREEVADQGFHARVVIGTVEGGDPGFDEAGHVGDRLVTVDPPVAAGQVPASLDETGDRVAGRKLEALDGRVGNSLARHLESASGSDERARRPTGRRFGESASGQVLAGSLRTRPAGAALP